jgi:transcriptional regulator with XRE-family HTH domain
MFMGQKSGASRKLPMPVAMALKALGENLRIARERRGEPLRQWAGRCEVSVPTLQRMEAGDPSVSMGVYATAVWLCERVGAIEELASPENDAAAHDIEIARAASRRRK